MFILSFSSSGKLLFASSMIIFLNSVYASVWITIRSRSWTHEFGRIIFAGICSNPSSGSTSHWLWLWWDLLLFTDVFFASSYLSSSSSGTGSLQLSILMIAHSLFWAHGCDQYSILTLSLIFLTSSLWASTTLFLSFISLTSASYCCFSSSETSFGSSPSAGRGASGAGGISESYSNYVLWISTIASYKALISSLAIPRSLQFSKKNFSPKSSIFYWVNICFISVIWSILSQFIASSCTFPSSCTNKVKAPSGKFKFTSKSLKNFLKISELNIKFWFYGFARM